ncbi:MAG: DUF3795 domain-containing protein [Lachnospiraceae bacterium]|nr:DUF3795 domain-containing protein [Lachnospiraceae bacterium]
MGISYCGKNCDDCLDKAEVGCPGCKSGPGKAPGMLCEIARCCNGRLDEECTMCASGASCELLAEREAMMQKWNGKRSSASVGTLTSDSTMGVTDSAYGEQRSRARDRHNAPLLRTSLLAIFWLFLLGGTGNVLSNENLFGSIPGIIVLGSLLNLGASIAQAVLMIRLGQEEDAYKIAGICMLVATGLAFVGGGITGYFGVVMKFSGLKSGGIGLVFGILLVLAAVVLEVIGGYQFLVANARVVERRDAALSERWYVMSKLFFVVLGGIIVVPILMFLLKLFGIILAFLYIVGVLAFGVCEYVFLYQTANRFRE